ncbi:27962_t:CDS:2, partial [Racocetra persica]
NDLTSNNSDNSLIKFRLYEIEARYMNFPDKQQRSTLLQRLDDILAVPEIKLSEIKLSEKIIKKGHPSETKRLPIALELMEAGKKQIEDINSQQNALTTYIESN